jgi:AraC-like DNA-binding protein
VSGTCALPEYTIDAQGAVRAWVARLLASGVDRQDLARRLEMDDPQAVERELTDLDVPGVRWPASRCRRLWELACNHAQTPEAALILPVQDRAHPRHVLVHAGGTSGRAQEALDLWCSRASLVADADRWRLSVQGKVATLRYAHLDWQGDSMWMVEYALSRLWAQIVQWTEGRAVLRSVNLALPPPHYAHRFSEVFRAPVTFDAAANALVFDAVVLNRPIGGADRYLHRVLCEQVDAMHARVEEALPLELRVRRAVIGLLDEGHDASAEAVAGELGVLPRRLRQQLEAAGTSFREQLEQVKRDGALRFLCRGWPNAQVAGKLGFSEASALHHAFKRWHGMSVGAFLDAQG